DRGVLEPAEVLVVRVLGPHARIIETRGDRVRLGDLAVVVLQHVAHAAVQHTDGARTQRGAVLAAADAVSPGLDAHDANARVAYERPEQADRVRASAHAGDDEIGQAAGRLPGLGARLLADDAMEVTHHHRIRVRAHRGAEQVVRGPDVRDPVPERFVDGVLERPGAALDRDD